MTNPIARSTTSCFSPKQNNDQKQNKYSCMTPAQEGRSLGYALGGMFGFISGVVFGGLAGLFSVSMDELTERCKASHDPSRGVDAVDHFTNTSSISLNSSSEADTEICLTGHAVKNILIGVAVGAVTGAAIGIGIKALSNRINSYKNPQRDHEKLLQDDKNIKYENMNINGDKIQDNDENNIQIQIQINDVNNNEIPPVAPGVNNDTVNDPNPFA
ncbi:glycine zipper family protein [Paraburkholderia hayleyella]|uniref:glycine zipper family protein n=1 Tax=Paraburkholderia hayleyella TaxID=2152889 RepID=UPI001291EAF4|nr:glycine zipper family protein [Paraburkholderia hayleyella]